jgi:integrase/recombinase XerD
MTYGHSNANSVSLFTHHGQRKYLCKDERTRFQRAANRADRPTRLLALLLLYTGCRISEALATTPRHLDGGTQSVIFRTLKRRQTIYRAVPVPTWLLRELATFSSQRELDAPLWSWCRQTAWRHIATLMDRAAISGPMACPRGLRHGFGIRATARAVPPNLVQRWMGHASPDTTAIYLEAVGQEERQFAGKMW